MIARDEQLHLNGTQHILSLLAKEDPDFERIQTECIVEVYDMFFAVSQQEKDWVNYLFKDGSMLGMNEKMLCQYVDYITSVRMKAIGLEPFGGSHTNPFSWLNNWLSSDNVQVAPQETEISSYLVGQIDSNLLADDFTNFEL
jgi:ribonucleoside-diphosphate reductase beta chain